MNACFDLLESSVHFIGLNWSSVEQGNCDFVVDSVHLGEPRGGTKHHFSQDIHIPGFVQLLSLLAEVRVGRVDHLHFLVADQISLQII
jgi:hypothetical protein